MAPCYTPVNDQMAPYTPVNDQMGSMRIGPDTENSPTVCVLGCGPGGMFFLHALATRRAKLLEEGDLAAAAALPVVTCYERTSSPGGVWRSSKDVHKKQMASTSRQATKKNYDKKRTPKKSPTDSDSDSDPEISALSSTKKSAHHNGEAEKECGSPNMYEALWTNGCKEAMEFFDYTYDEHFKKELPTFLPRKHVLEYMLKRVTLKENIFEKVSFDTTVTRASYDESRKKFDVSTVDNLTGIVSTKEFDKCIWACGMNGKPSIPTASIDILKEGKFKGRVLHSAQMGDFDEKSVKGKRILFVGSSYSAEDVALHSIKLGAKKVFISLRGDTGAACDVSAWPGNKVKLFNCTMPCGVTEDGTGILLRETTWNYDTLKYEFDPSSEPTVVKDISAVLFCTGYSPSIEFLAPSLRSPMPYASNRKPWKLPADWKMKPNVLSDHFGEVKPAETMYGYEGYVKWNIYRHLSIDNPSMMYLYESTNWPLLDLDVGAYVCLAYICGDKKIPSRNEMMRRNHEMRLSAMDIPDFRYGEDRNYADCEWPTDKNHWYNDKTSAGYKLYLKESCEYGVRIVAGDMAEGNYPVSFGSFEKLNSTGEAFGNLEVMDSLGRYELKEDSADSSWRTFRDCNPEGYKSIFTGIPSIAFDGPWMELDDEGKIPKAIV
eukprot:scaffold25543_cov55-Attheya_sp.AAC.2